MRPRRVCPEKEALKFIASGKDKDTFQSRVKRKIVDEQKRADLCAFVTTNITTGEEMMFDCGDPDCSWRQVAGCLVHYRRMDNTLLDNYTLHPGSTCIPHLLPEYIQEQFNPPFNFEDPSLHYYTHVSPRVLDNLTPQQTRRYR